MDCQTIRENELHEKYLLGRLTDHEKFDYQKHINQCKSCKSELDDQSLLISGIRETGRREMKEEIRQLALEYESGQSRFNWPLLAKIAAVLFVIMMTPSVYYIYNNKNTPQMEPVPEDMQKFKVFNEERVVSESDEDKVEMTAPLKTSAPKHSPAATLETETIIENSEKSIKVAEESALSKPAREILPFETLDIVQQKRANLSEAFRADYNIQVQTARAPSLEDESKPILFEANGLVVKVHLKSPHSLTKKAVGRFSDSFLVEIVSRSSEEVEMNWYVDPDFMKKKLEAVQVEILPGQTMQVILTDGLIFRIDMKKDTTRAVLRK